MRMMRGAFLVLVMLVAVACGDDSDGRFVGPFGPWVGGPCRDILDCVAGSYCVHGGDFPDGMCTVRCRAQSQCPDGSACIDREGGICMQYCFDDLDCRQGYHCKERDDFGDPGRSLVCIK